MNNSKPPKHIGNIPDREMMSRIREALAKGTLLVRFSGDHPQNSRFWYRRICSLPSCEQPFWTMKSPGSNRFPCCCEKHARENFTRLNRLRQKRYMDRVREGTVGTPPEEL